VFAQPPKCEKGNVGFRSTKARPFVERKATIGGRPLRMDHRFDHRIRPARAAVFVACLSIAVAAGREGFGQYGPGNAYLESVPAPILLSLDDCIATALENQPAIERRRAGVGAAEEQRKIARSYYLPNLGFHAQYAHLDEPRSVDINDPFAGAVGDVFTDAAAFFGIARQTNSAFANAALNNPNNPPFSTAKQAALDALPNTLRVDLLGRNVLTNELLLTQPLYTGGKIRYRHQQASLGVQAACANMSKSEQKTVFDVTHAYLGVQFAEELVQVADDMIGQMRAMASLAQALLDQGDEHVSVIEVHRARAVLAMAEEQRIGAAQGRRVAYEALRQAMGMQGQADFAVADPRLNVWRQHVDLYVILDEAMIRRPELARSRLGVQIADLERKLATSEYLPDIGFFGRFSTINDDGGFVNPNDREEWAVGVTVGVPLFEGGRRVAQQHKANYEIMEAEKLRQWVRSLIVLEVQRSYLQYVEAADRIPQARKAMQEWAGVVEGYRNEFFGDRIDDEDMPAYFKDLVETKVLHAVAQARYHQRVFEHNLALAKIRLVSASDVYQSMVDHVPADDPPGPDLGPAGPNPRSRTAPARRSAALLEPDGWRKR
jgi:outer membrane protein TolC